MNHPGLARWAAFVLLGAALVPAGAQETRFRWVDREGQERCASRADDVPAAAWTAATLEVHGTEATSGDRFHTAEGVAVVIEGIQAPDLDDDGTVASYGGAAAKARLDALIRGVSLTLEFEGDRRLPDGDHLAHVVTNDGVLLARTLLEEGRVRLCLEEGATRHAAVLRAALAKGRASRSGVWERIPATRAEEPAVHRGVSLGLFGQEADYDYTKFLDEIRDVGASHVLLASPWLMRDWRSNESRPVAGRTAGWPAVQRVTKQARERGLRVGFLPLVLLSPGNEKYWRGTIAPSETWIWFRNYGRLIGQWADLADDLGVSLLCVGSEFGSLESHTARWRTVIANVRSRFGGKLTYSANWDRLRGVEFWDDLDIVGMTGYHELTDKDAPTVEDLAAAWAPIKANILSLQKGLEKPILFTEVGYPSQNGANKKPWNYLLFSEEGRPREPDDGEQADCFRAFARTWTETPPSFKGVYLWNWWRHEDPRTDVGYSVYGKPAHAVVRDYFSLLSRREKK